MAARGLSIAGAEDAVRVLWFKFQTVLLIPTVTAVLCFVVEYAGLGRWLTRSTLVVLAVAPLALLFLVLTNHLHHLVWTRTWFDAYVHTDNGPAFYAARIYIYVLSVLHLLTLLWLFVRSPRHRMIVAFLLVSLLSTRIAFVLEAVNWSSTVPIDPMIVFVTFAALPYAMAVFRFRMFDVVAVARDAIIEQMANAVIVLDFKDRIVDFNMAAQTIFNVAKSKVINGHLADALGSCPELLDLARASEQTETDVFLPNSHWYHVSVSPLFDKRGIQLGRTILLHDITKLKQAQMRTLEHQRALAMLNERESLARELHDGMGQVLAAAQLQIASARELLAKGDSASVEACLRRAGDATQEAKESIRKYLLGIKARSSPQQGLIPVLRQYLAHYRDTYGIHTELAVPAGFEKQQIDPVVESQLQPIIQEALINARRHGRARSAMVVFEQCDGQLHVTIEDDGCGFDPSAVSAHQGFGLRSMRGRAEALGGVLEVSSKPGGGTRVNVQVPLRKEKA
jgi:PAS domain S-box-containing protein